MKRKVARYWYGDGTELVIFVERRKVFIYDTSNFTLRLADYPGNGTELGDWSYETLGLYYDLPMPDTGWSGDC